MARLHPETRGGRFSRSDMFTRLIEHLRQSAEECYMIGHDMKADGDTLRGQGFLAIGQMLEKTVENVTKLAIRRSN